MKKLFAALFSLLLVSVSLDAKGHTDVVGAKVISHKKADYLLRNGKALFLDARGEKLYLKGTIAGSLNMPVKKYAKMKALLPAKETKLVTFCNGYKCEKSDELAQLLINDGYKNVLIYKGGFPEWKEKGYKSLALLRDCKEAPKGPYKPTKEATINGIKTYLGQDNGMIDQFWFSEQITKGKVPANYQLVDVRKPEQFKDGHLKGAINIPQDPKTKTVDVSKLPKDKLVVFYCNTGMMSVDSYMGLDSNANKNVLYLDANVECKNNKCSVKANENL